jgi:nicotinate-nucleotide--dimethylbenzimidazole phosphoribosyltransferase
VSELPATPLGGVRLAGDPPVTSDVAPAPKAVMAEGVMPLPASAPAVPAAPAPEPPAETATLPVESLLLRFRMITPAQLADAMKEEAVSGKSVATIVVEKGWVAPEAMAQIAPSAVPPVAPAPEPAPVAAPNPVFEAPAVEQPMVEVAAPAPEPEPVPVAPEPVAPLMPEPVAEQTFPQPEAPVAAAAPPAPFVSELVPEPETLIEALAPAVEPAPAPEPVPVAVEHEPQPEPVSALQFQVLAHLTNGERVEISRAGDMDEAKAAATAAMHALREGGDWPLLSGRYVRPESIISIDVALLVT